MSDGEKSHGDISDFQMVGVLDDFNIERSEMGEFGLAFLNHYRREISRVNRRIADAVDNVGKSADVVEVSMGDDQPRILSLLSSRYLMFGKI